jgi:hypothetical protein
VGEFGRVGARATDWVTLLCGLLAAIPVAVATAHAVDIGWTPSSDDGMIALRAFDVLSPNPPLLGQYSQGSRLTGEATHSLGPMLYWVLAVPAHVGPRAIPLAMAAVNVAAVVGSVLLAGRRGGRPLAIATALALALMTRALPVEVGYEVWNPWAGLFPLAFLLFLGWSVACGDHRLLPLLAVTASYVMQLHLIYVLPGLAAAAVGVAGLVLYRRAEPAGGLRAWVVAALILTVVCWSGPLIDQAIHRPGNLALAYRVASEDHETGGLEAGWKTVARAIGVPPWWAKRVRTPAEWVLEPLDVPAAGAASAAALVATLFALLIVAVRRRRHDLAAALVLALLLILCVAIVTAGVPRSSVGLAALGYVLVWTVPAGMWVWLVAGWSAWSLFGERTLAALRRHLDARGAAAAAGLAAVGAAAVLVAAGRDYDDPQRLPPGVKDYRLVESTTKQVMDALEGSRGVVLDVPLVNSNSLTFQSAIAYAVRRKGLAIGAPPRLAREMGDQYRWGPGAFDELISIRNAGDPVTPGTRIVVRNRAVSVMLKPWTPIPSKSFAD